MRVVDINLLTCKNHILKIGNVNVCFLWLILYESKNKGFRMFDTIKHTLTHMDESFLGEKF